MRSLYSGVSGIRSHQTRMDVIGNNIANVNTIGFKSSRVTFTDVFNQTLSSGSQNTNPQQIGLGVGVGSTDLIQEDGSFQMTGRALDLAISGSGLFVMKGEEGLVYSRAGGFDWSPDGYLFSPSSGLRVQGWMADENGQIGRTDRGSLQDIRMIRGDVSLASASTAATFKGNLDAAATDGTQHITAFTAYDSLGRPIDVTVRFTKETDGWKVEYRSPYSEALDPDDDAVGWEDGGIKLAFNSSGKLEFDPANEDEYMASFTITEAAGGGGATAGADPIKLKVDFRSVTQAFDAAAKSGDSKSSAEINTVDGRAMGILQSVYVNESGIITGRYSNGTTKVLAQIGLANFNNMAGLMKVGSSTFAESPASGVPQIGAPSIGGRGSLVPGNLEGSNVDLAGEFTNMILTQRGFQASTRMVSTADDMLQELINLRR